MRQQSEWRLSRRGLLRLALCGLLASRTGESIASSLDPEVILKALMQALIGVEEPSLNPAALWDGSPQADFKREYYGALSDYLMRHYGTPGPLNLTAFLLDLEKDQLPGEAGTLAFISQQIKMDALRLYYTTPAGWGVANYLGPQLRGELADTLCPG